MSTVPSLELSRMRLLLVPEGGHQGQVLPTAPAWRGAFGTALRHAACLTGAPSCEGCTARWQCHYAYLFETPPPPLTTRMRRYPAAPHPFVLWTESAPQDANQSATTPHVLGFSLIGKGITHADLVLRILERVAHRGVGRGGVPWRVLDRQIAGPQNPEDWHSFTHLEHGAAAVSGHRWPVPAMADLPWRIEWLTPLRLQHEGQVLRMLNGRVLLSALLRRISLLSYFHMGNELEAPFAEWAERAHSLELQQQGLRWQRGTRQSSRQGTTVPLDGLTGELFVDGRDRPWLAELWPWFWLGQWLHLGKSASLGLGQYRISSLTAPVIPPRPSQACEPQDESEQAG